MVNNPAVPNTVGGEALTTSETNQAPVSVVETPAQSKAVVEASTSNQTIFVGQVSFEGNKTFSSDALAALLKGDLGKEMTLSDMKGLAGKVQDFYHRAGYQLARVVVPKQNFSSNEPLRLTVLEGWLGKIEVKGNRRFSAASVVDTLEANDVEPSKAFTLLDMEQALTRLNRLSGLGVMATLQPGAEPGATDALINVAEADRVNAAIEFNNYGSRNTGRARVVPSIELPNLSGRGDVLSALGVVTLGATGVYTARLGYTTPVNALGDRASVYASHGTVVIGGALSVLDIKGDNTNWGLGYTHDFVRSARSIYSVEAWLEGADVKQKILGSVNSQDKIRKLRLGASLDQSDTWGRTLVNFGTHVGLGTFLGGMPNNSPLSSHAIADADGHFTKFTLDLARVQRLSDRFSLIPQLSGQYAVNSVVSGESWGIGGYGSVSGHAVSAYTGDSGFTTSLESRARVFANDDRYQFIARVEEGMVFVKEPFIGQPKSHSLTGALIGFQASPLSSLNMRVDFSKPLSARTEDDFYVYAQARYSY